jgi:hypothetical protein
MRAAALIVQAIRLLRKDPTARLTIGDSPAKLATLAAIKSIKTYYRNPVSISKPDWLDWLEGNLQEAAAHKKSLKRCQKCKIDGCNGWAIKLKQQQQQQRPR